MIDGISEQAGTPCFSFKDLGENKPAGSIRIRVETIDSFFRHYREDMIERENKKRDLEARLAEFERRLRSAKTQAEAVYEDV